MALDHLTGGVATARRQATAEEQEIARRAEQEAKAARYLVRTGNEDLLPILGIGEDPEARVVPRCAVCGGGIVTLRSRRKYCSPECSVEASKRPKSAEKGRS